MCWGKHVQGKNGSQAKQPEQKTSSNVDFNNPNFVEALTKVVSQTLGRGAGGPSRGQQQAFTQPQQLAARQQNIMTNQNQPMQLNSQQPMMMPMMMLPTGQNVFYPTQQGGQGTGQ